MKAKLLSDKIITQIIRESTILHSFKDEDGKILTVFTDEHLVEMLPYTISFESDVDYQEPSKDNRLDLLVGDFDEDEEQEFLETEIVAEEEDDE